MENNAHLKPAGLSATLADFLRLLSAILAVMALVACGGTRWSASHPDFRALPAKETVGVQPLGESFMLTRPAWFSEQLAIPADSIHDRLGHLSDSVFVAAFRSESHYSVQAIATLPEAAFASETQKLDDKIYLKVRFPHQGVVLTDSGKAIPRYLLLIHEFTWGTDLRREQFYDYRLANQELVASRHPQSLSLIVSFTLWDNARQIPLYSSIAESQLPIVNEKPIPSQFLQATAAVAADCARQIRKVQP